MMKNKTEEKIKKRSKRNTIPRFILLYILCIMILYIIIFVVPRVTGFFTSTYIAEYGQLRIEAKADGYFIRNEVISISNQNANLTKVATQGQLVRKGDQVVKLSQIHDDMKLDKKYEELMKNQDKAHVVSSDTARDGGIVSYYLDGYETKSNAHLLNHGNYDDFSKMKESKPIKLDDSKIAKNQPIYKLIDKSHWNMVAYIDRSKKSNFKEGHNVFISFSDDAPQIQAEIIKISDEGKFARLILESTRFSDEAFSLRHVNVTLIAAEVKGLILEKNSIIKKDGNEGVFVKTKSGKYSFKPVYILGESGNHVAIKPSYYYDEKGERKETVNPFQDILKNPK